ncbi:hypothetical protein PAXRUDRAFT_832388 [Paxillus rubicundulus Ve08.2h10]|uniref:Uncharacterized protein n=1 Tax=Paxillus rubicundulus Ve08.2h10 TaxID=930991 RepID=A0A0D0D251_9AGAM|nr:hypothetical protein PAXRUDRAFT_832388 [Paxillus rubicundulus Ve08.2h10]
MGYGRRSSHGHPPPSSFSSLTCSKTLHEEHQQGDPPSTIKRQLLPPLQYTRTDPHACVRWQV